MLLDNYTDELSAAVRYALETTRATAECPFHPGVVIRVGDDAAESHAYERAKRIIKSDGTAWDKEELRAEFARQIGDAADSYCPRCKSSMSSGT